MTADQAATLPDPDCVAVYVTVPDKATGKSLAGALVERRLAACVNIVPGVESVYHWDGKIETDEELLLIAKTTQARLDAFTSAVNDLHPYDVPEVIALPLVGGSERYLTWLRGSVVPKAAEKTVAEAAQLEESETKGDDKA